MLSTHTAILWLIYLLSVCTNGNEIIPCNNKDSAKTPMMKLKLTLLCGYDKYLRPVLHDSNKTEVGFMLAPRIIEFDDMHNTMYLKAWLSMNWNDVHLSWDKLQHDDIGSIMLDTSMIWVPDLSIYNSRQEVNLDQEVGPVMIMSSGNVYALLSPEMTGHCVPNWANWPYDIHKCNITLGSKRYLGSTLNFKFHFDEKGLFMHFLLPDNEWEIIDTSSSRNESRVGPDNDTDTEFMVTLDYQFTLRRHASVYVASYLIPGVVMMILSLGLLWIPSDKVERTAILCTLMIIQPLYLQYLAYKIPSNGDTTPYLVCYYRDCLCLTGMLIVETLVTRSMASWTSDPPYLQSIFRFIAGNRVLQYFLISDIDPKNAAKLMEAGNDEGSSLVTTDQTQQWKLLIDIVNRSMFYLLVPVYLLLSLSLLPLNISVSIN
ncbi:neuronal acetylcholine receptor subunit alpha-7-like [Homalodisca vitripennis]|uniref:neuronal acetylcholine receptor subunit alpha-7-like n=1 Tax=Homalodisca vitripennis TaxID=197043 RepID=UPI001EECA0EB|nr:neuronal acetylcholine receptor subunit alpha-7-like [Homalodisca vitripennis]